MSNVPAHAPAPAPAPTQFDLDFHMLVTHRIDALADDWTLLIDSGEYGTLSLFKQALAEIPDILHLCMMARFGRVGGDGGGTEQPQARELLLPPRESNSFSTQFRDDALQERHGAALRRYDERLQALFEDSGASLSDVASALAITHKYGMHGFEGALLALAMQHMSVASRSALLSALSMQDDNEFESEEIELMSIEMARRLRAEILRSYQKVYQRPQPPRDVATTVAAPAVATV